MKSIAIMNQKGGVGKTTTAVNLSAALTESGHRVCLIDLDPQAHASLHLGLNLNDNDPSIYDVLTGHAEISDVRHRIQERMALVPAHLNLAASDLELAGEVGREMILRNKLAADPESFDFLILDCPPSLGVLTLNALTAVQEVLLPLQPQYLALHGLSKLLHSIDLVQQRLNPQLQLGGVVFCMYDAGTRLAGEVTRDVREFFAGTQGQPGPCGKTHCYQTRIRRNIRLAEAPSFGQSIFQYAPSCHGAEDYRSLADEYLGLSCATPAAA